MKNSLKNSRISSPYGNRIHPIKKVKKFHNGVDIAAPSGTNIYSPVSGTVVRSADGWNGGFGNVIEVKDTKGYQHLFAHQSKRAASVGARVSKGSLIGHVGTTGSSTGNHLHYGIRQPSGGWMNPNNYSMGYGSLPQKSKKNTKIKDLSTVNMSKKFNIGPLEGYYGNPASSMMITNTTGVSNTNKGVESRLDNIANVLAGWREESKNTTNSTSIINSGNTNTTVNGGTTVNNQKAVNNSSPKIKNENLKKLHKVMAAI
jgi:murein DD-endopeptidase MepM/ murein hydrolase activator NlpD